MKLKHQLMFSTSSMVLEHQTLGALGNAGFALFACNKLLLRSSKIRSSSYLELESNIAQTLIDFIVPPSGGAPPHALLQGPKAAVIAEVSAQEAVSIGGSSVAQHSISAGGLIGAFDGHTQNRLANLSTKHTE